VIHYLREGQGSDFEGRGRWNKADGGGERGGGGDHAWEREREREEEAGTDLSFESVVPT
jgi:hypothetical protein